ATGLSEATLRRKVVEGQFPKPRKLSTRCTRWVASDVMQWLREQGAAA
ncbi:MAG: AlpA family phage regulatory protein, partial [Burkholderiaceae bacterium]